MRKKRSSDPSIENEPHLRGSGFKGDKSEEKADRVLDRSKEREYSDAERVERSVWDEPALSSELAGAPPADELTYKAWLEKRWGEVGFGTSMAVTLGVALVASPWGIIGAFYGAGATIFSVLAITVFGPVVEEVSKIAVTTYVVEKRPFYFRSAVQIAFCALMGALVFSIIENLTYQHIYKQNSSANFMLWRWTVCLGMHLSCSVIASLGLMRVWRETKETRRPPRLHLAYPYIVTAVVIHGTYNAFAIILSVTKFRF